MDRVTAVRCRSSVIAVTLLLVAGIFYGCASEVGDSSATVQQNLSAAEESFLESLRGGFISFEIAVDPTPVVTENPFTLIATPPNGVSFENPDVGLAGCSSFEDLSSPTDPISVVFESIQHPIAGSSYMVDDAGDPGRIVCFMAYSVAQERYLAIKEIEILESDGGSGGGGPFNNILPVDAAAGDFSYCNGLPDADNTGPYDTSVLQPRSGMTVTTDGAVIENFHITGGGINVQANNVTIRNGIIEGADYAIRNDIDPSQPNPDDQDYQFVWHGLTIENVILRNSGAGALLGGTGDEIGSGVVIRRSEIHDMVGDAIILGRNVQAECNYMHRLGSAPMAHTDCFQTAQLSGMDNFGIYFNHCAISIATLVSPFHSNAGVFIRVSLPHLDSDNVDIRNNFFSGGNYTISLDSVTNYRIERNLIGDHRFGAIWTPNSSGSRAGNICAADGATILEPPDSVNTCDYPDPYPGPFVFD